MKLFHILSLVLLCSIANAQVQNGNFESWSGNSPTSWSTIDPGISVSQATSPIKEGSNSAKVIVSTASQANTDFRQTITVIPGQAYTFSVWVYHTEGNMRARLYVNGYRGYSNAGLTNQWQQISYNYTPTTTSLNVGLRFYDISGFDGSEIVYIDDFQPTSGGNSGGNCTDVKLMLNTDQYASETSWTLKSSDGQTVASGNGYANNSENIKDVCLEDGDYTFKISDSYGDGICCNYGNGNYNITSNGNTLVSSNGNFGSSETKTITIGAGGAGGSGYYSAVAGLTGYALKTGLYDIIKGHNNQGYGSLWGFYNSNEKDAYYENDNTILDMYSENPGGAEAYNFTPSTNQCGNYSSEGDCYNREHSFPKSWFGGTNEPMNSDAHHIFPSDGYMNGIRSNYPFGEVGNATYTGANGTKRGGAVSGFGYNGTVFEPIDEFKGDFARAWLYMAVRYENVIGNWENNTSFSDAVLNGTSNQVFETWVLNMLRNWHAQDPVSQKELDRNEAVFTYQGNRNPFIDHPEYVNLIWGAISARTEIEDIQEITVNYKMGTLMIRQKNIEADQIHIFDMAGREVFRSRVTTFGDFVEVPVDLNPNQMYIVRVQANGQSLSKKLMAY